MFNPTHKITFTSSEGEVTEYLVALYPEDGSVEDHSDKHLCGPAYTEQEEASGSDADWALDSGEWRCCGQTTPGGANGSVEVERT